VHFRLKSDSGESDFSAVCEIITSAQVFPWRK